MDPKVEWYVTLVAAVLFLWFLIETGGAVAAWWMYRNDTELQTRVQSGEIQPLRFGIKRRLIVLFLAGLWVAIECVYAFRSR